MKLKSEFIKCESKNEVDLTENIFQLILELERSLCTKDHVFAYNYYYRRPDGTKVYLCKMDERYRRNALKYFEEINENYSSRRDNDSNKYEDYECDFARDVWLG